MTESPGGATVRSVRVRMELDIASYQAKAQTLGRTTEGAAQRMDKSFAVANRRLEAAERNLDGVSAAERKVEASTAGMNNRLAETDRTLQRTERSLGRNSRALDSFSGRTAIILKLLAGFGPALIPLGGVGVTAVAGVASQLGFATAAAGSAVLAFQGVGDSLKAIEQARLDPTVENLQAAREAVARLAPEAQVLVRHLEDLRDEGRELQFAAAGGFLPGVDEALTSLESRIPQAKRILREISDAAGDALADGADSLASDRWDFFFQFLKTQARPQLDATADSVGNLTHGIAELVVATTPLQSDFTGWLRGATEDFDTWASRLSESRDFAEFVDYVRENGPEAAEAVGAITDAFIAVIEAGAPLGGPALQALEAVADVVGEIADSNLGTPILTLLSLTSAYSLVAGRVKAINDSAWGGRQVANLQGFGAALTTVTTAQDRARMSSDQLAAAERRRSQAVGAGLRTIGKGAAVAGALALATSGVADKMGLANTMTLGLAGSMAGPWGAAVGAGVGLLLDYRSGQAQAAAKTAEFTDLLDAQTGALTEQNREYVVNELTASKALGAAQALGIDLATVTDAALGNKDALSFVNDELERYLDVDITGANGAEMQAQATAAAALRDGLAEVMGIVSGSQDEWEAHAAAMGRSTSGNRRLEDATMAVADATEDLRYELGQLDAFFDKRAAFRAYQASLDELRASLREGNKSFSEFTNKGRDNLELLDQIATNAIDFSETITNPRNKGRFLADVKADLLAIAQSSPAARAAVREILPALNDVIAANKDVVLTVRNEQAIRDAQGAGEAVGLFGRMRPTAVLRADTGPAETAAQRLEGILDRVTRPRHINITAGTSGDIGMGGVADGGTIRGQRLPYRDKVLTFLAPGEEVISNRHGQADRHRPLLKQINANRYAEGGTVGRVETYTSRRQLPAAQDWASALGQAADAVSGSLRGLERQLKLSERAVEKERATRDAFQERFNSIRDSTVGMLTSDIFATREAVGPVWGAGSTPAGAADPIATLQADIAQAAAFDRLREALKKRGLDDGALEAAAAGGLAGLQQIAGYSQADLELYERLFNQRASVVTDAGRGLAQSVVGAQLDRSNVKLDKLIDRVKDVKDAIKDADDNNQAGHRGTRGQVSDSVGFAPATGGRRGVNS